MIKGKQKQDVTGDVKYLELLAEDFKDYMKESRETIKEVNDNISQMNAKISRELGGIQTAIKGSNARIKKVENKTERLNTEVASLAIKHPNGSLKRLLWKGVPWIIAALISGGAGTGYAFSKMLDIDSSEIADVIEKKIDEKVSEKLENMKFEQEREEDGGI